MSENSLEWGLAAYGRHGDIEIQLDAPIGRDGPWFLQITGRGWDFAFAVADANAVREFSVFVKEHNERKVFAEHRVGSFEAAGVFIVKDPEFADRFWLRIRGVGHMAEVTIQAEDAVALGKALEDLVSDLAK